MHLTIEETDEGTLICLHLAPSETLPDPESFARQLRRSLPEQLEAPSRLLQTDLRLVPPVPLEDLPVAGVSRRQTRGLSEDIRLKRQREAFLEDLEDTVAKQTPALGGFVGLLSHAVAPILPFEGESVSQQFSLGSGLTMGEVHIRMGIPFFGLPSIGRQMAEVLKRDFQREAVRGNVEELQRAGNTLATLLETVMEATRFQAMPFVGGFDDPGLSALGVAALARAELNLKKAQRFAKEQQKKAERVRRGD